jgi:EAL domain-containing protein (putative c-di-GMP-specific phosphodiesterase class I)
MPQAEISEEELQHGIDNPESGELLLVYQPKVHIQSGEITGVETLARWKHPERGVLGPGAFIPLAERTDKIDALTNQIYRKAVQQTSDWMLDGINLRTSVNFSINSFSDPGFSDFIISTTEEVGVNPTQLILEVTETQVMKNAVDCLEIMMRMRLKKFGLSIDDFGTGNSSMTQLKTIPFTELKVDREFVHGAANNSGAQAILEASVALAKNLQMEIVCEGAETREDWDLVEQLGCDYVQGFYCARPMPNEELLEFIAAWNGPHVNAFLSTS